MEEEEEEEEEEYEEDGETGSRGSRATSASLASDEAEAAEDSAWERTESQRNSGSNSGSAAPSLCSDGHLSTVAPEDVFLDHTDELKPVELDTEEAGSLTRQLVKRLTSSEIVPPSGSLTEGGGSLSWAGEGSRAFLESSLEEAIHSLLMRLESLTHRCRELQDLEQEVMRLEDLLKVTEPLSVSLLYFVCLREMFFLNALFFLVPCKSAILQVQSKSNPTLGTDIDINRSLILTSFYFEEAILCSVSDALAGP